MTLPASVKLISSHILTCLSAVKQKPLFVALQGPQGSGKSYLTALVKNVLSSQHALRVAVLSIDDLYLPHSSLVSLASEHPGNPLWRGRGQPGTHDVLLGRRVLQALKDGVGPVEIPRFEKSLFNGEGDRLPMDGTGTIHNPPIDVVIMEGWCMGFYPISGEELDRRWSGIWKEEKNKLTLQDEFVGTKENIELINNKLFEYTHLWSFFDVFIQVGYR